MQHRAAIAQPGNTGTVEQVRVDAGHLGRAIGTQAHHAARQLIHQFEGLEVERFAGPREQGLQMLQQWRHHEFVAIATCHVQEVSTYFFDVAGLGRQDIGNVIREDPGGHEIEAAIKTAILPVLTQRFSGRKAPDQQHSTEQAQKCKKPYLPIREL
jgi:hypothetical protein